MHPYPKIIISASDSSLVQQLSRTVSNHFNNAGVSAEPQAGVLDKSAEQNTDILFLEIAPGCEDESLVLISQLVNTLKNITIIPLVSADFSEDLLTPFSKSIFFYLNTPLNNIEAEYALKQLQLKYSISTQSDLRTQTNHNDTAFPGFIGRCNVMSELFNLISRIAEDEYSTVLIRGESGTGKELVARAIHSNSNRKQKNFVPVNCAAIPDDLLESELFGHTKGAFTGATQSKIGRIQYADGGTLFLDEIGDMKPALQAKLLRVLQEKEFEPVGSLKATPVDTRVLAATHCDLEKLVREGQFREDLYYRLSVIPLEVPPLRQRTDDIPLLLESFTSSHTTKRGRDPITFTLKTIAILQEYEWRGNVRELENLVQHMSILYSGQPIHPHHLPEKYTRNIDLENVQITENSNIPASISEFDSSLERAELLSMPSLPPYPTIDFNNGPIDFNELINEFEKELIVKAMKQSSGNKKEAARILCLKRTTLLEKIKKKELTGLWEN